MTHPKHPGSLASVLALCALLGVCGVAALGAQPSLRVIRERSLVIDMRREPVLPRWLAACRTAPGMAHCVQVLPPTHMEVMRLHVSLMGQPSGRWRIQLRDASGLRIFETLESSSPVLHKQASVWTDRVPAGAQVQVWADAGAAPPKLDVKELAYIVQPAVNQAIHGIDGRIKIADAPAAIRNWASAVARLRIMGPEGQALCTGFLMTDRLMLTNEHCVSTDEEARSMLAEFGYDVVGSEPDRYRGHALEAASKPLDYALLRLEGDPGVKWKRLAAATSEIEDRRTLVIVQHPLGGYKQASIEGCEVRGPSMAGEGGAASDFGHECDTLTGSSGSPVVDRELARVMGLHHWGFNESSKVPVNQAVRLTLILADMKTRNPGAYKEITTIR